jgi:hypothetical protein
MLDEKIKIMQANIEAAAAHLKQIENVMALLEQAGMYPAIPHFQFQERNGSGEYLYLLFRQNHNGSYQGPDGKRKIYIGADQKKQDEARLFAQRREIWERLKSGKIILQSWITANEAKIIRLDTEISRWALESKNFPKSELPEEL